MFLEQCKYVVKERKMPKYITDNIEVYSSKILVDKFLMKQILIKKILMKKNLMKKFPMKKILMKILIQKIKYTMCLFSYLKYFKLY